MIREQAIITGVKGDSFEIDILRRDSCDGCSLNKSCGVGALGRLFGRRSKPLIISSELNLKAGDHILLGIADQGVLMASLVVYGLPLLMLVIVATVVHVFIGGSDLLVAAIAAVGLFCGLLLSRMLVEKYYRAKLSPTILQINNEPISSFKVLNSDSR